MKSYLINGVLCAAYVGLLPRNGVVSDSTPILNMTSSSRNGLELPFGTGILESTMDINKLCPPKYLHSSIVGTRAIPTNNWWGNIIAYDQYTDKVQPVWSNPYSIHSIADASPYGMAVSYPRRSRMFGGSTGNSNANKYYAHGIVREITFSAEEFRATKPTFEVIDWMDEGVKVQFGLNSGNKIVSNLVSGMAYATFGYTSLVPRLVAITAITSVNDRPLAHNEIVSGSQFEIKYNNGQKWILYALSPDGARDAEIALKMDGSMALVATSTFSGMLRIAIAEKDDWKNILDDYRHCVVLGANIVVIDDRNYKMNWETIGDCNNGLLHFAQKHLENSIDLESVQPVNGMISESATRGMQQAFATRPNFPVAWKLTESQELAEDFYPATKIPPSVAMEQKLLQSLRQDITQSWNIPLDGSYYFNGKAAQKYASLCLMAKDQSIVGDDTNLLSNCLSKLHTVMEPFLNNSWTNKLLYDKVYRGVISSQGLKNNDLNADFGNTMYNDHHFHYGYWVYTAAIINFLDPTWDRLSDLNGMATLLIRDVANYDAADSEFPLFRSFDWYRGHSYSHGVTPFADGKDQESTSEDVNFSFGMYLFGKVTGNTRMMNVGKLMTRVNTKAIRTYFLITNNNDVHPNNFRPNKVTGIFFDNKADYATWFSAEKYAIHGIQMLPVSPITEFVRDKIFVQQEWSEVLSKESIVTNNDTGNAWLSLLYLNYAIVNKWKAMQILQNAKMDDGLTKSWALYMAASYSN